MKKKIVIASVLKPVNDARNYEKLGISLARHFPAEVHMVGFYMPNLSVKHEPNITFHPLYSFKRLSFKRLWAGWLFLGWLRKNKPDLVIVCTWELLGAAFLYKLFSSKPVIYDVQENYWRNIWYTRAFPFWLKPLLAPAVRIKEWSSRLWVNAYLLAERNYEQEFSFTKGKSAVVENKFKTPSGFLPKSIPLHVGEEIKLLYTGTISENYGIESALDLAARLYELDPGVSLKVIGYCPDSGYWNRIKPLLQKPYITLVGGDMRVPHLQILEAITEANLGLITYLPNKSTENCIPTKLYEYMANHLPMLIPQNPQWEALANICQAALVVNYQKVEAKELLHKLRSTTFYTQTGGPEMLWEGEEKKLINQVKILL